MEVADEVLFGHIFRQVNIAKQLDRYNTIACKIRKKTDYI